MSGNASTISSTTKRMEAPCAGRGPEPAVRALTGADHAAGTSRGGSAGTRAARGPARRVRQRRRDGANHFITGAAKSKRPQEVPRGDQDARALLCAAVEAAIRARHPYELPEIVAVPISHGLARLSRTGSPPKPRVRAIERAASRRWRSAPALRARRCRLWRQSPSCCRRSRRFASRRAALDAQTVEARFAVADGYYLYRDKLHFAVEPGERRAA